MRALSRQAKRHEFMFGEATASVARIDDEGAAVCCVEEEDAARGVVSRRDPTIFSQTVHKSTTKAQPCACVKEEDAARGGVGRQGPTIICETVH